MTEQSERVDALVKAWILDEYRDEQHIHWSPPSHLSECPDVTVTTYEAQDGAYGCNTGCSYLRLEATLSCPHGETTEYEYGEFGDMADIIAMLIDRDERQPESR